MAVAPFSHFSAVSELFVTAGVFYFFWKAMAKGSFRWAFIAIVIAFESIFNITYMASRMAQHETHEHAAWATALLAVHGALSFLMFVGLIAFVFLAFRHRFVERVNYFLVHRGLTWTFLVLWTLSVASGEAIYALQLSGGLQV